VTVPTITIPDEELAAVTAAIRGVIEDDKFPHAPRLDPLRAALASRRALCFSGLTARERGLDSKGV
jgi:hypothetical protein